MFEQLHVLILLVVVMAVAIGELLETMRDLQLPLFTYFSYTFIGPFPSGIVRYFASPRVSLSVQSLTAFSFMLAMFGTLLISIDLSVMGKDR